MGMHVCNQGARRTNRTFALAFWTIGGKLEFGKRTSVFTGPSAASQDYSLCACRTPMFTFGNKWQIFRGYVTFGQNYE